jgi:hypothetical protein
MSDETPKHDQRTTNHYVIHYPAHAPREGDPHYAAFNAYHRANSHKSVCFVGQRLGFDQCADAQGKAMLDQPGHPGLELHHKVLEFSLINAVDLAAIALDFPDLTDEEKVAAWAETEPNFMWLCAKHHRGAGGIHHAAAADFEAELYVRDLIGPFEQ